MAPEIFRKVPYSAKADMWALGCVLYEVRPRGSIPWVLSLLLPRRAWGWAERC